MDGAFAMFHLNEAITLVEKYLSTQNKFIIFDRKDI
jgi:hypothetical protein